MGPILANNGAEIANIIPVVNACEGTLYCNAFSKIVNRISRTKLFKIIERTIPTVKPGIEKVIDYVVIRPIKFFCCNPSARSIAN